MNRSVLSIALVLLLPAVSLAMEHAHEVWGGWVECDSGYVMLSNACVAPSVAAERDFIVSSLPSAGDGAPGTCPSGGCGYWAPAYYSVDASPAYYGGLGWSSPYYGGLGYFGGWNDGWARSRWSRAGGFGFGARFHSGPQPRFGAGFAGRGFVGGASLHVAHDRGRRR